MGYDRRFPQRLIRWTYVCVCVVLILSSFVFPPLANFGKDATSAASSPLSPPPEGNGYTYSRGIVINHSQFPTSDQVNFPLLISGTYSYLATVANGGRVQNSNGYDIIFTSDSGCATKLNHEVETYNAGTGAVNYWVKVPTVYHTSDTTIYMCYGNSSITTDQSNKTAVWDANYKGVWHLPNGTSLTANDSTSSGVNGTITSTSAATGQIDGCGSFNGSSGKIDMGNASALDGMTALTISAWIKPNSLTGANRIFTKWRGSFLVGTKLGAGDVLRLSVEKSGGGLSIFDSPASTLSTGSWQHCVLTWSQPNTATMYVNGTAKSVTIIQDQSVTSTGASSTAVQIGYSSDGLGNHFDGLIDEVRMSNVVRSADWSKTEYNNQSSPSTFYTISAPSGNQTPVANTGGPYSGTSLSAMPFTGNSSSDPDGTITGYSWNFGDPNSGSNNSSLATPTHTYARAGTYPVTLTVTDNSGATNSASTTATISNRPPVANANGPYASTTGTAVNFSSSGSSDPDGTISYAWNFGDTGSNNNTSSNPNPSHTYATAGPYTVTLTVTDDLGATNTATTSAAINHPPVANANGPYASTTGTAVNFSSSGSSDPDGTIASYAWNFGDTGSSSNSGSGAAPSHTYATAGTYTVTLTVTDDLGATATATASTVVTATLDARLDPLNRTGGGGEDPLSRNFNWSIPLVGLPGRAGLDLGLSLSYNSLATWTRNGNIISFDDDHGSPAPGFRLGFPVIQGNFYNSQAGKYSYIMITPSGSRLELRQVGASTKYQSIDSSYVLLDASNMKLRTTDGTQLSYAWKGNDYQCTEIKDRNGNFITINYDGLGRVATVKDTLARTITFNYDTNSSLSTITQSWTVNGQTLVHPWATFAYTDIQIQTNFTNLTVYGPSNNSTIHALTQVKLADNSHFDFDYTSWGQVWKISQYTGETSAHLLNYRSYDLPMTAGAAFAQTNCPRFTVRHDWAENWNRDNTGTAQEVNTFFDAPIDASLPDNSLQTVTMAKVKAPDNTYQLIYFAGNISGGAGSAPAWKRGLPLLTDTFESGNTTPQRSATTTWTQDDTSIAYQLNPRVTETNITDPANNHARTRTDYASTSLSDGTTVNLPVDTYEYQSNATTVLRRTHIVYKMDATYTNRRIIGLPLAKYLCDGSQGEVSCNDQSGTSLFSKVTFEYDESGSIVGTDAPVQHDIDYTASSPVERGNLSSVTRHDVVNTSQSTTSTLKYNTAGALVATLDLLGHGVTISYADKFSANGTDLDSDLGFTTLAYPTKVTDADGFSSSTRYNYAFGGATWKRTPLPNVTNVTDAELGPMQTIEYDSLGRTKKVKSLFNNAYTRYEYPPSQNRVDTYATIQDNAGEAHSFKITDGHGRVIASAADHPGSTGGFSGQLIYYDLMGRSVKSSNPTETSASSTSGNPYDWPATGDDAVAGWIYTQQTYDWKGRPLVTTNPSTTGNPADTTTNTASYDGCGCAGGQVVTLNDEVGRRQKIYSDVVGRQLKTEILNTDLTVYSTTTNTFNARDQVTLVRQYQGPDTSTVYQDSTMSYDGYGRLLTKHIPQQQVDSNNSSSTDHTSYVYNSDDTVYSVTDARGASATYSYNPRHLVTSISYSAPAGITPTASISYAYDSVGNRISMTDGLGSTNYSYNQLSRMTLETRTLSGLGTYTLNYDYNLAGQLNKITDATNTTINYGYDTIGRLNGVTGSDNLVGGVSSYASGLQYRAWGSLKQISAGASHTASFGYNARLQANHFDVSGSVVNQNYDYYNDGRISFVHNTTDNNFDRAYEYDQAGRLTVASTGGEARHDLGAVPMYETFEYNAWDNPTYRFSESWLNDYYDAASYTNGRRTGWEYDADGRVISIDTRTYGYDAGGHALSLAGQRPVTSGGYVPTSTQNDFDGDGNKIRETSDNSGFMTTTYYLRSSVLGGAIVEELNSSGQKLLGYVYTPAGSLLARQVPGQDYVMLKQIAPIGVSQYEFFMSSTASGMDIRREFDPAGANVRLHSFSSAGRGGDPGDIPGGGGPSDSRYGSLEDPGAGCTLDGVWVPCSMAYRSLESGAAVLCPDRSCLSRRVDVDIRYSGGHTENYAGLTSPFAAYADGQSGFMLGDMLLPDGFNVTFTGFAARAAANSFFSGTEEGNFGSAVSGAINSGLLANLITYFVDPQRRGFVDFGKVQDCATQMFQVENAALDWRPEEGIMRFDFHDPNQSPSLYDRYVRGDGTRGWFSVTPDFSMTWEEITARNPGARIMGGVAMGWTSSKNPSHPYIGNDLERSTQSFYGLFVHEIGNALGFLTGKMHIGLLGGLEYDDRRIEPTKEQQNRWGHNDAGVTFEDCVFGRKVSP